MLRHRMVRLAMLAGFVVVATGDAPARPSVPKQRTPVAAPKAGQRTAVAGPKAGAPTPVAAPKAGARQPLIAILAYHHIDDDPNANLQTVPASYLRAQIRTARAQGWTFMKLSEVLAHRDRLESMPPRVMVLTFDDGYRSFLEKALPVLRAEKVPAVLAPITSFVGTSRADLPPLLDWAQLRAIATAGDVELVSHTHAVHRYDPSDPHGGVGPSVSTRRWLEEPGRYEHRDEYRDRLAADFTESRRQFEQNLKQPEMSRRPPGRKKIGVQQARRAGHAARRAAQTAPSSRAARRSAQAAGVAWIRSVLVWPYGFHNEMARTQAATAGFTVTLSLEERGVTAEDLEHGCLPRLLVTRDRDFSDPTLAWLRPQAPPMQAMQIDMDALWDPDATVFRGRIDNAATRARAMGATHVIVPAFSNPRRDGYLLRSFAMNHQLPVIDDVWAMVAHRFADAGLRVWVQVPTMNLTWVWDRHPDWRVGTAGWFTAPSRWATRVSPDVPEARNAAVDLLTDLAVYLPIDGMLFDDDAGMAAHERLAHGGSRDPALKARAVRGLIEECKREVRAWRPQCQFGRIVTPQVLERAGVNPAQSVALEDCYTNDDFVVVPLKLPSVLVAGTGLPESEVERLARRAVGRWRALGNRQPAPVLFLVPSRDPKSRRSLPADRQHALAAAVRRGGLVHIGAGAVAAEGELPVGLLERRSPAPRVKNATRR